jgi:predicted DNA-binding transcriptional regulator AlpA
MDYTVNGQPSKKYVSAAELAAMTPLSENSIWRYARLGLIPAVKVGRRYMFDPSAVFATLEQGITTPEMAAK